jgi:hypothetical protein
VQFSAAKTVQLSSGVDSSQLNPVIDLTVGRLRGSSGVTFNSDAIVSNWRIDDSAFQTIPGTPVMRRAPTPHDCPARTHCHSYGSMQ